MKTIRNICLVALTLGLIPNCATASLQLVVGDIYYVGSVRPSNPSSETDEAGYINTLIGLAANTSQTISGRDYVRSSHAGPFDTASVVDSFKQDNGNLPVTLTDTFQYVFARYGGPLEPAGPNPAGQYGLVWYLEGGFTGEISVPETYPLSKKFELSHITFFNPVDNVVPEPGTMAVWGLLAVTGYFGMKKKYQTKA